MHLQMRGGRAKEITPAGEGLPGLRVFLSLEKTAGEAPEAGVRHCSSACRRGARPPGPPGRKSAEMLETA